MDNKTPIPDEMDSFLGHVIDLKDEVERLALLSSKDNSLLNDEMLAECSYGSLEEYFLGSDMEEEWNNIKELEKIQRSIGRLDGYIQKIIIKAAAAHCNVANHNCVLNEDGEMVWPHKSLLIGGEHSL